MFICCHFNWTSEDQGLLPEWTQTTDYHQFEKGQPIDLQIGDYFVLERTFTASDVRQFAEISGDKNPVHLDQSAALARFENKLICHGILTASTFSNIFGMSIPGSIYVSQNLTFRAPVFFDEKVRAVITVTSIRTDKKMVTCSTTVTKVDGLKPLIAIDGSATVMVPELSVPSTSESKSNLAL